jgi:LuxR family transcriptional regulator, maltose regulon positive regulatory protein
VARRIPYVADGTLHVLEPSDGLKIAVGSPSWIAWLTDPATRSFSFKSASATYTARKESRARGGEYWTAYRRHNGKLRKVYLGRAEDLTLDRLDGAAATLVARGNEATARPHPDASGGAAAPATKGSTATEDQGRERSPRRPHGDPLLSTKLSVPSARPSLVPRVRLIEKLEEGLARRLTLVSAPAGFGKSTLLGAWVAELSGGRLVAWLSLDPGDNDPARFWRYFVSALDQMQPGSGAIALALLGSPQSPPMETLLTILLNDLADIDTDSVLVLDDFHLIEHRDIHEALTFLIDHLPPRMHLVIATRADPALPLARLRARGALSEVRAADLRFTPEEAATFLNEVMGLGLTAEDIAGLERHTEGWIAGLQLAALAMQDRDDASAFIAAFTGSNRHVVDYLAEEVLGRQPEELQTFLLETSILERMRAPLCDAITGHTDGRTTLGRLEHANLFVIPLDDERRWYRYHHLFADVLRQRLRQEHPDLIPELHKRASGWFEEEGLVTEAVHHSLAAQDWEIAIRLIESSGMTVVLSQQGQTVLGWIDEIPEELVGGRPDLCTIRALALVFSNRPGAAEVSLQRAERCLLGDETSDEARAILGRVAVIRAAIARFSGDLERSIAIGRKALELLPETEATARERASAGTNAVLAYQVSGDVAPANERPLEEAIASFRASGALIALLNGINHLARMRTLQGRLRAAVATYEEAAEVASGRYGARNLVNSAAYYVGLGDVHREWNDLDPAESHLRRGTDLVAGAIMVEADVATHGYLSLARLQQARGRLDDAFATLERFANLARQRDFAARLVARSEAARARVALMQDDLPAAVRWAEASELGFDDEPSYPREEQYLTLVRVLIAQGRLDPTGSYLDDALGLLDRLLGAAEDGARMGSVIEILVLRALALQAQNESSDALATLERALVLAQPEGYVRIFVDEGVPMAVLLSEFLKTRRKGSRGAKQLTSLTYVRRLLAALESPHTSTDPSVGPASESSQSVPVPLTTREREVLTLVVEGLSNREIAARLFIEVSTVKGYVHSLLRKLEVDSRTQAISRANELHLLSP